MRQVHGSAVVSVGVTPGLLDREADALVSDAPGACLAVIAADCALVALASPEGVIAAVHAGWRGLVAGVLAATVEQMRTFGASAIVGFLGPCIRPECYAFGVEDLDLVARRLGDSVRGRTTGGEPALDLSEGVRVLLEEEGVTLAGSLGGCTACEPGWFSHRGRQDVGRHALAVSCSPELLLR